MWFDIIFLIICCTWVIYFVDSYPVEDTDPDDANFFKDGRPPKWDRTSRRRGDKVIEAMPTVKPNNSAALIGGRIVGGTDADINDLPYQVAVLLKDGGQICGGTVYNKNFIITAAHCVFEEGVKFKPQDMKVVAGELDLKKPGDGEQHSDVAAIIVHQKYDQVNGFNDLAVFKLVTPLKWTATVQPLRIATIADNNNRQDKALVSGWGYTKVLGKGDTIDDALFPNTLKMVELKLISKPECKILHKNKAYKWAIHPSFLCAGHLAGGRDSCQADSGGPLACYEKKRGHKFLCGVVSNGIGCARKNTPGFYTDVAVFADWIQKNAGKQV